MSALAHVFYVVFSSKFGVAGVWYRIELFKMDGRVQVLLSERRGTMRGVRMDWTVSFYLYSSLKQPRTAASVIISRLPVELFLNYT